MNSTAIPTAILPYTINHVLDYISQLEQPLPSHLISKSLLQRHHFVRPGEPYEYLCWPSPLQHQTIALLGAIRVDRDSCSSYPVRYFFDGQTYAHVAVTSSLRIIFQWDTLDGWKYHDSNLMPFPVGCTESLEDAMSSLSSSTEFQAQDHGSVSDINPPGYTEPDLTDDDAYWDAYGREDDSRESDVLDSNDDDDKGDTEDAYWAQYATVQGSGDSTLPSPLPLTRNSVQGARTAIKPEEPIVFSRPPLRRRKISCHEPPSPTSLTVALNALSPRRSPLYIQTFSSAFSSDSESSSPDLSRSDDNTVSQSPPTMNGHVQDEESDEYGAALREDIGRIYRDWMSKYRSVEVGDKEGVRDARERFLRIVDEVVGVS